MIRFIIALFFLFVAVPVQASEITGDRVLLMTEQGAILLGLYDNNAPKTTAQLRKLVGEHLFDMVAIPRIEPGFVVQVADVWNSDSPRAAELWKTLPQLPFEGHGVLHKRGSLSIAHGDDKGGQSSFSILLNPAPHLDGGFTVFGEVLAGWKTLDGILALPRDGAAPIAPLHVIWAELVSPHVADTLATTIEGAPWKEGSEVKHAGQMALVKSFLWGLVGVSLIAFAVAKKATSRTLLAFNLLTLLITVFGLLVVHEPKGAAIGTIGFFGLLLLFRVFASFENRP